MANHVSHAALPYLVKGCRFTLLVPYLDIDGTPTDPTTPDTEISKDGAAFADNTEEVTTISGGNGMGYITLTGDETNCSLLAVAAKVASGPKPTLLMAHPRVLPVLRSGTAQAGAAGTITLDSGASAIDDFYNGCIVRTTGGTGGGGGSGSRDNQARIITDYNGTTKVATVVPNWETNPDSTTTFEVLLTENAVMRLADVNGWRGSQPNNLISGRVDANTQAMANDVVTAAVIATGAIDADAIAADAIGASEFAQAAADKIWSSAARTLTAFGFSVTVGTNNDKTGYALTSLESATLHSGTAQAGGATSVTLAAGASATDDLYNGQAIKIYGGTGAGQTRVITDYVGSTKVATVDRAWATNPDNTSTYAVLASNDAKLDASLQVTAASVQGNVTGSVASVTGNVAGSVGSVTGNVGGNVVGSVGSVASGGITSSSFAAGAIDAAAIATDAIGANEFAQAAADKIWSSATRTLTAFGFSVTVGTNNDKTGYALTSLESTVLHSGTAQAGGATSITLASGASSTDDLYNGQIVKIYGGTGAGQTRVVTDYVGSTKVATVDRAWATNPDNTSTYAVLASNEAKLDASLQVTAASVQGNVTGSVASVTGNVGGNVTGSVGSVTGNVGGNVVGSVGSVASGGISASSFAAGAIDAAAIATDAIGANEFAQAAADKIWSSATRTLTAFGFSVTVGTNNDKTGYALTSLESAILHSGTAQAGGATSITLASGASATDDLYNGQTVKIYGGTGAGQTRVIIDYVGSTKVATVDRAWATNPDNTSTYAVLAASEPKLDANLQVTAASVQGNVTGSVASVTGSVGSVTGNVGGNVVGSVGSVASGGITSSSFAAGAITASAVAADAIGASELAADAVAEIADAIWDEARSGHTTAGTFGQYVHANVTHLGDSSAAGTALLQQFDGTGLTGGTYPARQDQVENIANTGAPVNATASSFTLTTGSQTNTYTATFALDTTRHTINDSSGTTDCYYEFNIGGDGVPTGVTITGYLTGSNDSLRVFGFDWGSSTWVQIGLITGGSSTTDTTSTYPLFTSMVGTGANLGLVRVRFQNTGLTSSSFNVNRIYLSYSVVNRSVGYSLGAVWIDTVNGTAGTTAYINGTADKPVSSLADARTIALALGIKRFFIIAGSSLTLAHTYSSYTFLGNGWTLALGGQDVSGSEFVGATVSGTCTGTTPVFTECQLGTVTLPPCQLRGCGFTGTITFGSAGSSIFDRCYDAVAGAVTPVVDYGSGLGAQGLSVRKWSGGIEIRNLQTSDEFVIDGMGRVVLASSCTGGSVIISGNLRLTDNSTGVTITDGARWAEDQSVASVTGSVGSVTGNVGGNVTGSVGSVASGGISASSFAAGAIDAAAVATSAASEIADAVWSSATRTLTAFGFSVTVGTNNDKTGYALTGLESAVLHSGTAQAGGATSITLATGASATDDLYNGQIVKIYGGTGAGQTRVISDYVGSTKVATVDRAWATNPDNTSTYAVLASNEAKLDASLQVTAASVQGNVTGSVASVTGNVGGNVTGSVGSVAGNVGGNVTGSVGSVASGGISASSFAAGAIDAAAIATDAIGASEFAQAAADKIWSSAARTLTAFGFSVTVGTNNDKTGYALTGLESAVLHSGTAQAGGATSVTLAAGASATDDLYNGQIVKIYGGTGAGQTRVVTDYVGSTKVATVDRAWVTNPDNTSTYAILASNEAKLDANLQVTAASVQGNVTGSVASVTGNVGGNVAGSVGSVTGNVGGNVAGSVGSVAAGGISASSFAAGAIDAAAVATDAIDAAALAADAATEIAAAVWDRARSSNAAAGSFGQAAQVIRDGTAQAGGANTITLDAGASSVDDFYNNQTIQIIGGTGVGQGRIISDYVGSTKVATVNGNWATNPDNTSVFVIRPLGAIPGAAAPTAAEVADAVWDEARADHITAGTFGRAAQIIRDGTAQGGGATSITLDAGASGMDDFYNNQAIHILGGTGAGQGRIISDYVGSTKVATVNGAWATNPDNTSIFAIRPLGAIPGAVAPTAAEVADAVWDEARADHTTNGTFGQGVASVQGNVTGSVASVVGNVGGNVTGSVGAVAAGGIAAAAFAAGAISGAAVAADAAGKIADAVWDEALADHGAAGSTGAKLTAAGNAGDPWSITLPGSYQPGTAGYVVGRFLDAAVSSRARPGDILADPRNKLAVDQTGFVTVSNMTLPIVNFIVDKILAGNGGDNVVLKVTDGSTQVSIPPSAR